MKVHLRCFSLVWLCGCGHDLSALTVGIDDAKTWLPEQAAPECVACVIGSCRAEGEACLEDPSCRSVYRECYPPNPSCGLGAPVNRDLATCIGASCADVCYPEPLRLSCLGGYSLPEPRPGQRIDFDVKLTSFWSSPVRVQAELCQGPAQQCEPDSAVELVDGQTAPFHYTWSNATQTRPYVRVYGEGVPTTLSFEDLPILPGHRLPLAVISANLFTQLLSVIGAPYGLERGTLTAVALDCTVQRIPGVRFSLERDGRPLSVEQSGIPFYLSGELPVRDEGTLSTRESTFVGGFAELEPGVYDLIAQLDGREVGRTRSILVLGGAITNATILPTDRSEALAGLHPPQAAPTAAPLERD
jgi:hypothetical protein